MRFEIKSEEPARNFPSGFVGEIVDCPTKLLLPAGEGLVIPCNYQPWMHVDNDSDGFKSGINLVACGKAQPVTDYTSGVPLVFSLPVFVYDVVQSVQAEMDKQRDMRTYLRYEGTERVNIPRIFSFLNWHIRFGTKEVTEYRFRLCHQR